MCSRYVFSQYSSHIAEHRLPINVATLCDVVDEVCASVLMNNRYMIMGKNFLHEMVLPKSWMVQFVKPEKMRIFRHTNTLSLFLPAIGEIIRELHMRVGDPSTGVYLLRISG